MIEAVDVAKVYRRDEIAAAGGDPAAAFVLAAAPGYQFSDLRGLLRRLRVRDKHRAAESGQPSRTSRELLRLSVVEESFLVAWLACVASA